jgi:hypothetical protein
MNLKFMNIFAATCAAVTFSCGVTITQSTVEMKDANAKFTMQLGGDVA